MPAADDIRWFKETFGAAIDAALPSLPFDQDMILAIACQETGEVWPTLRKKPLPVERILTLCVGDTIDYQGPGKGRQAFPRNKDDLLAAPHGADMFKIARQALEDMAAYIPGYSDVAKNPDKFCHGFGVFQRDIQFFKEDPDYFLDQRYAQFSETLGQCLTELSHGLKTVGLQGNTHLSDEQFAAVAIAYNTGRYKPAQGLKQGYFDGQKYYGERIFDFIKASRAVTVHSGGSPVAAKAGQYSVVARNGLNLRGGPGTNFQVLKLLPAGTKLTVTEDVPAVGQWAKVDLQGDGLSDGYVFLSLLASV